MSTIQIKLSDWLTIRSGCDILIYSTDKSSPYMELCIFFVSKKAQPDKGGYQVNIFFISLRKYMLWVLIRAWHF